MGSPLLEVKDLRVSFATREGRVEAVNGLSFAVAPGRTMALLGESGSGKSVAAQAIMGVLDTPPARIAAGSIRFEGQELVGLPEKQYRSLRGEKLAMIFQDALSALNPVLSVGTQIAEMFRVHRDLGRKQARAAALEAMAEVRIPAAAARFDDFPHQFSGGMRQRIIIAMMIALSPKVLIADEPTTALDVTVQAQIMELLARLQRELGTSLILISHDLGVVADVADDVTVMYAGRAMEQGTVADVYRRSANPYTRGLLESVPSLQAPGGRLPVIPGRPPSPSSTPTGCAFHPRCALAQQRCSDSAPALVAVAPEHLSRCWFAEEVLSGD